MAGRPRHGDAADKPIAASRHRPDQPLSRAAVADRMTHCRDPAAQRRFGHDPAAPHRAQHIVAGHDAVPVLQKIKQDVEHLALKRDALAGAREVAPLGIESIGPEPEDHPSLLRRSAKKDSGQSQQKSRLSQGHRRALVLGLCDRPAESRGRIMRAIAFHPANQTRNTLAAIFAIALSVVPLSAAQAQTAQQRLQAIFAMSPEEMAATSAFTRRAYEAQIAQIYRIQNKQIREIVLELVRNPVATAFGQKSSQSWLASPGSGWKSHHAYPGGLAVHTMEWGEVANAWVDAYDRVYGVKLDRDLVIAGLILHDWGKVWFLFDDATGTVKEPDWYPKAWGTKANWKWMGGHGAVLYAELIARDLPNELLFAAAAAHFDAYWALDKDGEGLDPALGEAAESAKKPAPGVKPDERMAEWWVITAIDEAWSFSTMVAAKLAFEGSSRWPRTSGCNPIRARPTSSRGSSSRVSAILRFMRSTRRPDSGA